MRRFLLRIGVFFLIIIAFDVLLGRAFDYLSFHAKGGDNRRNNIICNEVTDDILILGSSRALHHYNPIIIEDSLDMSCYNCGQDGNGAILNYGFYQLICQRYHPKVLIYDVITSFDLLAGEDNHKYLGNLRPYYNRKSIPEIFESVDYTEKYKMRSQMYRYNAKFVQIVFDYLHPQQDVGVKGFRPYLEKMDTMKIKKRKPEKKEYVLDSLKIACIKKMIEESQDIKIVFVVSPWWDGMDTASLQPIKVLCHKYTTPLINFANNKKYVHQNRYFKDGGHLNALGADEFTKDLVMELRKRKIIEK
ncbi:MAG: hypothetical protein J6X51_03555 [Bacteroidales bacterium]|nr:hypothetical protein [Bacteroidales bacterium]